MKGVVCGRNKWLNFNRRESEVILSVSELVFRSWFVVHVSIINQNISGVLAPCFPIETYNNLTAETLRPKPFPPSGEPNT